MLAGRASSLRFCDELRGHRLVMSLSPHWASTIYGFLFVAGQLISSMSLMIAVVVLLARTEPFASVLQKRHLHDLGKLLLAFVMLWAYFDFSQLPDIWSGTSRKKSASIVRGVRRLGVVAVIVAGVPFLRAFFPAPFEGVKRTRKCSRRFAMWLIFMRLVDLYWMTRRIYFSGPANLLDIVLPLALGGCGSAFSLSI